MRLYKINFHKITLLKPKITVDKEEILMYNII